MDRTRASEAGELAGRLVRWFRAERADLPWRRTDDPYRIWVAEVLLQQTTIATATPAYGRFLAKFPTLASLARAPLPDVMKAWQGLGYYARARRLHEAARALVAEHGGQLPRDPESLSELPGFGSYTSRSVAALAFGAPVVAVDGNVRRVLTRVHRIEPTADGPSAERRVDEAAQALVRGQPPREVNEGLMELGQRICRPRRPDCGVCPWNDLCRAHLELPDPSVLPPPARRPPRPRVVGAVGVLVSQGRLLMGRRPPGGLLGGLWEFPGGKVEPGEAERDALRRELREELGIEADVGDLVARAEHHYAETNIVALSFYRVTTFAGEPANRDFAQIAWVAPRDLAGYDFLAADRDLVRRLSAGEL